MQVWSLDFSAVPLEPQAVYRLKRPILRPQPQIDHRSLHHIKLDLRNKTVLIMPIVVLLFVHHPRRPLSLHNATMMAGWSQPIEQLYRPQPHPRPRFGKTQNKPPPLRLFIVVVKDLRLVLGMVLHKMSKITILGFKQKLSTKFGIFHEKNFIGHPSILVHFWN